MRASVTAPPYRVGEPITIAGTGLVPKDASRELGAALEVAHDPSGTSATRTVEHGAQTLDALGNFTYRITPHGNAALSGRCVEVSVYALPWSPGSPNAVARFTYP